MSFTQADFAQRTKLSDEVVQAYAYWGSRLEVWNARINLVAPSTISDYWHRHAYDSWQVTAHIPKNAMSIIDFGSGAGFPGLAIAIEMKARGKGHVTLVESAGKKVNFLRHIISELDLPAAVLNERAEKITPQIFDIVSARAFAPLPRLLTYAHPFWGAQTRGLFLKGQGLAQELADAQKDWVFSHAAHKSLTDPMASLAEIFELRNISGLQETNPEMVKRQAKI